MAGEINDLIHLELWNIGEGQYWLIRANKIESRYRMAYPAVAPTAQALKAAQDEADMQPDYEDSYAEGEL